MSVQVGYSKQFIFGLILLLIIFSGIEGLSRTYEFLNPNCTFVGKDAYQNTDFFLIRQMCEDLKTRIFTDSNSFSINSPNQHSDTINVNSFGFRGSEIDKNKADDVFRIFVIGGSTTFGYGATSDETTIPGFLQEKFKSVELDLEIEVINAGSPSATSYDEIKYAEKIIQELEPDLFIVYDGWNDAAHKIRSQIIEEENNNEIGEEFKFSNFPFYRTPFVIKEIFFFDPASEGLMLVDETKNEEKAKIWVNRWSEICKLGNSHEVSTLITIQPMLGSGNKSLSVDEEKLASMFSEKHNLLPILEIMSNSLNELKTDCAGTADLRDSFDGIEKPIFYDVGHTNDLGNNIIADKLFELSLPIIQENMKK